jgi:hypothetical protein
VTVYGDEEQRPAVGRKSSIKRWGGRADAG